MRYTVGAGSDIKRKVYFDCPTCASAVDSALEHAGQNRPCPACGREVLIPGVAELKILRAEETAREARRVEEQRAQEDKAAARARAREEKEAAEERAKAERREKRKRAAEKRRAAAAAAAETAPAEAPAPAEAQVSARGEFPAEADVFSGVEFAEAPAATEPPGKPRRKRPLVGILTACSLPLLCALVALWVRSEWVDTEIKWSDHRPDRSTWQYVHSARGGISYERRTYAFDDGRQKPAHSPAARTERPASQPRLEQPGWSDRVGFLGFGFFHDPYGQRDRYGTPYHWELIIPYWALCVLLVLPALISVVRRARARNRG